jgi:hypothetical protein
MKVASKVVMMAEKMAVLMVVKKVALKADWRVALLA